MKEYMKMSDVFNGTVGFDCDGDIFDNDVFFGTIDMDKCDAVEHAINSHDELVAEVDRLRGLELGISQLERLRKACTNMGISTPESMEDLGILQHHYIRTLINAAIDM